MAARQVVPKRKKVDKEKMKSLIQNAKNHWPEISISEELLQNPTKEFVKEFYGRFVSELEMIENNIRTSIFQEEADHDQNIHNDEISLTIKMKQILLKFDLSFNLNDMFEPQPMRTMVFLTCLMNVIIYLKSNTEYIQDIQDCVDQDKKLKEMKESKAALLDEIASLDKSEVELQQNINSLNQDIEHLSKEHKDILLQKAEREFKYQQEFKVIKNLQEKINGLDDNLKHFRNEYSSLQSLIVSENEVNELNIEIDNVRKELDNLDSNRTRITSGLEEQEEILKYYRSCLESIENPVFSSENLDELKSSVENLKSLHEQLKKYESRSILKKTELENARKRYASLQKNHRKMEIEFKNLSDETKSKLDILNREIDKLGIQFKQDEKTLKVLEIEVQKFEEIICSLKEEFDLVKNRFSELYKQLMSKQQIVLSRFNDALVAVSKSQSRKTE